MADDNNCMSVGFDWHGARKQTRKINGVDVVCIIISATLFELSFMHGQKAGAVQDAYVILKDTDYGNSLKDECSGGRFLYDGAAIGVTRALQNLM
jgi:hypothetical protein